MSLRNKDYVYEVYKMAKTKYKDSTLINLIEKGLSNREIADALNTKVSNIDKRLRHIRSMLKNKPTTTDFNLKVGDRMRARGKVNTYYVTSVGEATFTIKPMRTMEDFRPKSEEVIIIEDYLQGKTLYRKLENIPEIMITTIDEIQWTEPKKSLSQSLFYRTNDKNRLINS